MKGAKRILSVLMLVMMLCTFLSFPVGAIGDGTIPNFANSAWSFDSNIEVPSGGGYIFSNSGEGSASLTFTLVPGDRYKISGNFVLAGTARKYYVSLLLMTGENAATEINLIDETTKQSIWIEREFTVPKDYIGEVKLFVLLGAWSSLEYHSDWSIENTSTDKGILNSIKEGFSKLWEWLQNIWNTIKEIPTKIGQFITNLGDRISGFFTNLTNSIKGFFTDLWDKIWNGDGSVPPFDNNNKFAQVIEKLNEWTAKIKEFSGSVDSSADTVTGYLQSGTSFLNSAMGAFPAALTAVLGFALVFIVVRKVVGR